MFLEKGLIKFNNKNDKEPKHHCRTCYYFEFRNTYRLDRYTKICGFCMSDKVTAKSGEQVNEVCEFWSPNTKQESLKIALDALQKYLEEIKKLLG